MQFVLDCSVAISWCLVDENSPTANVILEMMPDSEAFVPGIWSLEIANVRYLKKDAENSKRKNVGK